MNVYRSSGAHTRERCEKQKQSLAHSVLAVFLQRNLDHHHVMDGVSTYLALTFGTLLSSQGTDASFVLTLSGFPPGASPRCFRLYQIVCPIRFPRCFPGSRSRVSLSGGSDFIRDSEPDLPPVRGGTTERTRRSCFPSGRSRKRTGAGRPDANRGAPLPVRTYESAVPRPYMPSGPGGRRLGLRLGRLRLRRPPAGSSACAGSCPRPTCPGCGG